MAVKRTGTVYTAKKLRSKRLFAPKFFGKNWQKPKTLLGWVRLILDLIGRPVLLGLLLVFQVSIVLLQLIKLSIPKVLFLVGNTVLLVLKQILQLLSLAYSKVKRIKLPKIKIPRIKIPKIVLPRIYFPRITKKTLTLAGLFLFVFSLFLLGYLIILKDLPSPNHLITRDRIVSTKIYDRKGRLLYKIYRNQNRTLVELEDIPISLIQATVAIEDSEFYRHYGFSFRGITRSFLKNLFAGKLEGGSTITQQLVKNALLTPERTLRRKIKELVLALQVEMVFPKDEILQMYLNEVSYGGAAYGAEEAAWMYFGKSVRDLSLAESALLAGLPASPTTYSPFGAHPDLAKVRQWQALRRMVENRFITPEQAEEAKAEELHFAPQATNIRAPHFVMYVKDLLVQKYGERMVEEGGLEVTTSLDLDIQNLAQTVVSQEIENLVRLKVGNGATLVTNPVTGEILAMVGSQDYFDIERDGNVNVTLRPRQPGSAIKPVNYSVALENGFTPATVLSDTPITYKLPGQPPYSPRNYDGKFHGHMPLRVALASSYNVPAVKVLSSYGVSKMIDRGQAMGITTWDERERFGLSLTLGGGDVKMVDMAIAYGILANQGMRIDLNPILKVTNYRGEVLEEEKSEPERVFSPEIAYILTDILSDNVARTPAFGPYSVLNIPGYPHVAVKTGTTQNLRDNWTIGYTPNYLVAVWVGNNDNSPMSYVASGITGASPIWHKIMAALIKDKPNEPFPKPENLAQVEICVLTGSLSCEGCPTRTELFLPGTEPKKRCNPEKIKELLEKKEEET